MSVFDDGVIGRHSKATKREKHFQNVKYLKGFLQNSPSTSLHILFFCIHGAHKEISIGLPDYIF